MNKVVIHLRTHGQRMVLVKKFVDGEIHLDLYPEDRVGEFINESPLLITETVGKVTMEFKSEKERE
jgi:hypothetical protein